MLTKSNLGKDIETMINFMRTPKMTKEFKYYKFNSRVLSTNW